MILSSSRSSLASLIEKYGSDKVKSKYSEYYEPLFNPLQDSVYKVLEIGIGTLKPEYPSSFVGNPSHYSHYTPGGSLRAWRDYFLNAEIFGIDIADDCSIREDRITTFIFSSLDSYTANRTFEDDTFDIIIDDGLHTALGQQQTLENFFKKLKLGGLYIIEDCGGGGDGTHIYEDLQKFFLKVVGEHEFFYGGNFIVIRKNFSGKGLVESFKDFLIVEDMNLNLTIVTGLWNISKAGTPFEHYLERFNKFLSISCPMYIYIPAELEKFVWDRRLRHNTHVRIMELSEIKSNYFGPFWDRAQKIRTTPEWYNGAGWLPESPQAANQWYNPIVMSKVPMVHDAKINNIFNTDYFVWLDAGLTNTVDIRHLKNKKFLQRLPSLMNPFLFLSYPYETSTEIHGFTYKDMCRYSQSDVVNYVCRGGLFGGHKDFLSEFNNQYYGLVENSLSEGLMGTEESIFTILSYLYPGKYRRFKIGALGFIGDFTVKFFDDDPINLEDVPQSRSSYTNYYSSPGKDDICLYMLTFNAPRQVEYNLVNFRDNFLEWHNIKSKFLFDNSDQADIVEENKRLALEYGWEHLPLEKNTGINRGRQEVALHFSRRPESYYVFFEDDMLLNPEDGVCRNGFRTKVDNLLDKILKIMKTKKFDFLKLSFTEVHMDNYIQCSWYNVPEEVRKQIWPTNYILPVTGLSDSAPRTEFREIERVENLLFITGDVYYANWPLIFSQEGNKKVFLTDIFINPYESTWMSYVFQKTRQREINPAVLLASPILHNRIESYDGKRLEC